MAISSLKLINDQEPIVKMRVVNPECSSSDGRCPFRIAIAM